MSRQQGLSQWASVVARELPCLSKPQAYGLAVWSFGMVWAKSCTQSAVTVALAPLLGVSRNTLRQRLRECLYDAEHKKGTHRRTLDVSVCFPFLFRWVLRIWKSDEIILAMDASTLADRFTVLAISVVYRGTAIPVAWKILHGNRKHAWRPHWLALLRRLRREIRRKKRRMPRVLVVADRGISVSWLFRRIRRLGWHPLLRVRRNSTFQPHGETCFQRLECFAQVPDTFWSGRGVAFQARTSRLADVTLLAYWHKDAKEPWFLLTDLHPGSADPSCYRTRAWIEQAFRFIKRGGWQWHRTRMTDPERADRLWLAMALATLWVVNLGGQEELASLQDELLSLSRPHTPVTTPTRRSNRIVSLFRAGIARWHADLFAGRFPRITPFREPEYHQLQYP